MTKKAKSSSEIPTTETGKESRLSLKALPIGPISTLATIVGTIVTIVSLVFAQVWTIKKHDVLLVGVEKILEKHDERIFGLTRQMASLGAKFEVISSSLGQSMRGGNLEGDRRSEFARAEEIEEVQ